MPFDVMCVCVLRIRIAYIQGKCLEMDEERKGTLAQKYDDYGERNLSLNETV